MSLVLFPGVKQSGTKKFKSRFRREKIAMSRTQESFRVVGFLEYKASNQHLILTLLPLGVGMRH